MSYQSLLLRRRMTSTLKMWIINHSSSSDHADRSTQWASERAHMSHLVSHLGLKLIVQIHIAGDDNDHLLKSASLGLLLRDIVTLQVQQHLPNPCPHRLGGRRCQPVFELWHPLNNNISSCNAHIILEVRNWFQRENHTKKVPLVRKRKSNECLQMGSLEFEPSWSSRVPSSREVPHIAILISQYHRNYPAVGPSSKQKTRRTVKNSQTRAHLIDFKNLKGDGQANFLLTATA